MAACASDALIAADVESSLYSSAVLHCFSHLGFFKQIFCFGDLGTLCQMNIYSQGVPKTHKYA